MDSQLVNMAFEQFDVVVVGNVGIDTNVYFQNEINFSTESNFTTNIDYVGQAGGYSSRGFAKLGFKSAFIGYTGNDHNGELIRNTFIQDQIDISGMFVDPEGTCRSINFMYPDGRRKNFYDGKNHLYLYPDLNCCEHIISRAKLIHFNIPDWARLLLPIARSYQKKVSCDIQDVEDPFDPYRLDFIRQSDFLFFSSVNHQSPEFLFKKFLKVNPALIMICGMGKEGCALGTFDGINYFPAVELDSPVIDTNGAGDSLAVGFLSSYLLQNYTLNESILRGQIAARHACTLKANSNDLISLKQLDSYYNDLPSK